MDILAIKPQTITVDLKHPATGMPIGISVECQSLESDAVKAVERQIKNKAMRSGRNTMTAEKVEDNAIAILSAAIVSWTWADGVELDGVKNPPCNQENKEKFLALPWAARQIDAPLGDETAFFTK